jgi:hypothetical protein
MTEPKALFEMKAEDMTTSALDKWLAGKTSRRILMLPFGGPIPSQKSSIGVDVDGEWFDEDTDIYGPHPFLRTTRERVVDWHHGDFGVPPKAAGGPPISMKGAILGRVVFDEQPESDGYWADWWANAGERRRKLVASLERRNVPLFGSTQAIGWSIQKADTGHIDTWPIFRHTISTSPQNTYAVVPPLKALLDGDFDDLTMDAIKAFLVGVDDPDDLRATFQIPGGETSPVDGGELAAKAGRVLSAKNEKALQSAIESLAGVLAQLAREAEEEMVSG